VRWSGGDVKQQEGKETKLTITALLATTSITWKNACAWLLHLKKEAAQGRWTGDVGGHYGRNWREIPRSYPQGLKRGGSVSSEAVRRVYPPRPAGRAKTDRSSSGAEDKIGPARAGDSRCDAIYRTDFLGFSYGFRPGRNQRIKAGGLLYTDC